MSVYDEIKGLLVSKGTSFNELGLKRTKGKFGLARKTKSYCEKIDEVLKEVGYKLTITKIDD